MTNDTHLPSRLDHQPWSLHTGKPTRSRRPEANEAGLMAGAGPVAGDEGPKAGGGPKAGSPQWLTTPPRMRFVAGKAEPRGGGLKRAGDMGTLQGGIEAFG